MGDRGTCPPPRLVSGHDPKAVEGSGARPAAEAWYDATWNPTIGCSLCSPGCDHCEAMRAVAQLARLGGKGGARYAGLNRLGRDGPVWTGEVRVREDLLTWPLFRAKPHRILVGSLSDLFHEDLATATLDALHAVIAVAHWHRFLVLTKRAPRMRAYYSDAETPRRIAGAAAMLSSVLQPSVESPQRGGLFEAAGPFHGQIPGIASGKGAAARRRWAAGWSRVTYAVPGPSAAGIRPIGLDPWPLPNLWLGVSVEDHERINRVGDLIQMPAALRWVCFEPLLGGIRPDAVPVGDGYVDALSGRGYALDGRGRAIPVPGAARPRLDWVVAGGETGAGARPTQPDWVRAVRDRCVAAGVPLLLQAVGRMGAGAGREPR